MCFFLPYPGTISTIISSFNSEVISSQGKIKIKSTFSAVLFEAFQETTKIYMADWFAFFYSALLQLFYLRFSMLLIFLTSLCYYIFFSIFKLLLVRILGVSLFNCSLSLFSSVFSKTQLNPRIRQYFNNNCWDFAFH